MNNRHVKLYPFHADKTIIELEISRVSWRYSSWTPIPVVDDFSCLMDCSERLFLNSFPPLTSRLPSFFVHLTWLQVLIRLKQFLLQGDSSLVTDSRPPLNITYRDLWCVQKENMIVLKKKVWKMQKVIWVVRPDVNVRLLSHGSFFFFIFCSNLVRHTRWFLYKLHTLGWKSLWYNSEKRTIAQGKCELKTEPEALYMMRKY